MNCKICGKSSTQYRGLCSNECFMKWIETDEFDKELNQVLDLENPNSMKNQIKQIKKKIDLFNKSQKQLEEKLIQKIGIVQFKEFIDGLNNQIDEESDNF